MDLDPGECQIREQIMVCITVVTETMNKDYLRHCRGNRLLIGQIRVGKMEERY